MTKRIIRRLAPEDMPAYMEIYLNAYPAGKDLSDACYEKYYTRNFQSMTVDKPEFARTLDLRLHAEQQPVTNTDY